jgi:hypothetical protein
MKKEEMASWQKSILMKQQIGKKQEGKKLSWWNSKINEMRKWWNGKLTKWCVDEITSW